MEKNRSEKEQRRRIKRAKRQGRTREAKWKKSARGLNFPGGDSGGEPGTVDASDEGARRGFKLPGFISINTAVATVCRSIPVADDRFPARVEVKLE